MQVLDEAITTGYRAFAKREAHGHSPTYEAWALKIAESSEAHQFLLNLPPEKRQPNLLFAAIRAVTGTVPEADDLPRLLQTQSADIRAVMAARMTQTNEPNRCAVLLPQLLALPQPLALLEVGASAGLCLLPDYYDYEIGGRKLAAPNPQASGVPSVMLHCEAPEAYELPCAHLEVAWRAGLDLAPIDLRSVEEANWLRTLVWPEQTARLERLNGAIEIARQIKPPLHKGDLTKDLKGLMETAPPDATLVVFHSAVLNYVQDAAQRQIFAETMLASDAVWLSNESPRVYPFHEAHGLDAPAPGLFLLSKNGKPKAWTGPHGQSYTPV
ncbi:DUF2332 domain-containing protein [Pseudovibrio exalbescens]|uniref:DUF2332 domain-containing protein n=1 Tax=Pseudovibrio exalbescens TaxID=197461 RepID=UPI002365482C|nr:DUF2332 domain-containing protein [Pseudovibrio exalbescens]MDD7911267.1 DUF2332 domain-containing protein [Pseudovibrio exalbescens]